jgi:hypothetical protein
VSNTSERDKMADQQEALTAAMPQAEEAVAAGAAAIEAEPDPAKRKPAATRAIKRAVPRLSEEEAEMIASALIARADEFADAVADRFEARGAFEAQPEPVTPPTSVAEPNATGAPQPTAAGQPVPEPPRKKTWAERFRGA